MSQRSRAGVVGVVGVVLIVLPGCGATHAGKHAAIPAGPSTPSATQQDPKSSSSCTPSRVLAGWPVGRLAAKVVAVPVLDFASTRVAAEVRRGAGGVLFLGSAPAPRDLGARIRGLQTQVPAHTRLLTMADEEGGGVSRLAPLVSRVPWPRTMARTMTPTQVRGLAARVGRQMLAAGVDVDLAPVADVDAGPGPSASDPDGARSFSGRPGTAATYTVAFLSGLRDAGVLPVVKHFPGLGGATGNTDIGPAATLPLAQLRDAGLVPFRKAIGAGDPAVMVSNASVPGLTRRPSSLSAAVIRRLLEQRLGFHGLVVTDSLSAGAVLVNGRTLARAAVQAIRAGADLVLFGSTLTPADHARLSASGVRVSFDAVVHAISVAVADGRLRPARLRAAALAVSRAAHDRLCG